MGKKTTLTYYTNTEANTFFQLKTLYMLQCLKFSCSLASPFCFSVSILSSVNICQYLFKDTPLTLPPLTPTFPNALREIWTSI